MPIVTITIQSSSSDLNLVPGAGLHSHHMASRGAHIASLAVGAVFCLVELVTIEVEVAVVILPAVHLGIQTVTQSPGSRHGHSEDS